MGAAARLEIEFATVPRLWPGSTIVCIGGGPSLTKEDVEQCRGQHVIAVNDAYRLAPWSDVLYACDARWWKWHREAAMAFPGLKYGLFSGNGLPPPECGVNVLQTDGTRGISDDPGALRTGLNSGYQAVNLAVHLGAARVVLLGFDMGPSKDGQTHWFGRHPQQLRSPYEQFRAAFQTMLEPLAKSGVEVLNASRDTALTCFHRVPLGEALR